LRSCVQGDVRAHGNLFCHGLGAPSGMRRDVHFCRASNCHDRPQDVARMLLDPVELCDRFHIPGNAYIGLL
jgi:hypothetical protein